MPRYEYECPKCKTRITKTIKLAHLDDVEVYCHRCWNKHPGDGSPLSLMPMKRLISCQQIQCDLVPYFDENITKDGQGAWVESRQHRKQLMKDNGLYERG